MGDDGEPAGRERWGACLIAGLATILTACGGEGIQKPDLSKAQIDKRLAQIEPTAPAYWLGRNYDGLPLTEVFPTDPYGPGFIYGKCEAGFDRGCAPPLQVQNHVDGGGVPTAPGPGPDCVLLKQVEGMPAVYAADALWLITADTVVVLAGVPGSTPREYLRGAAADLRLIADGQTEPQPPDDAVAALYAAACG